MKILNIYNIIINVCFDNINKLKKPKIIKSIITLLLLLFLLLIMILIKIINQKSKIKVCVCSPVKKENLYLQEFVEHYKNYNIDKIFLYDNNDDDGEHIENILPQYINSGFVKIINYRGKIRALYDMMNDCYKKNYLEYDWLIFYEIDEYIYLKNFNNIKLYLSNDKFKKCESIQLVWNMHTDNNQIYYKNESLKIRFPHSIQISQIKTILKGKIPNVIINNVHNLNSNLKSCDGFGNRLLINHGISKYMLKNSYYYIDHYYCKSTEEFIKKINKGDVLYLKDNIYERIKVYFKFNKVTKEKINFINKFLNKTTLINKNKFENIL